MIKAVSKGEMAYAIGKVHNKALKIQKEMIELDILTDETEEALLTILGVCEQEISRLRDRPQ